MRLSIPPLQGILAASKDLLEAFGTDDVEKVLHIILEKGEYHVSSRLPAFPSSPVPSRGWVLIGVDSSRPAMTDLHDAAVRQGA